MCQQFYLKTKLKMSGILKILSAGIIYAVLFTQAKVCKHPGVGLGTFQKAATVALDGKEVIDIDGSLISDFPTIEPVYRWDEQSSDWAYTVEKQQVFEAQLASYTLQDQPSAEPIEIEWEVLMNIDFKLEYSEELDAQVYNPVFSKAVKELDNKEIIIEGFVIPFEGEELLPLSFNPFSACFFCGKGSPASIISMYPKAKKRKRYKMDDFKKFKGILHLNYDDPNEFYYVLRDAEEVSR